MKVKTIDIQQDRLRLDDRAAAAARPLLMIGAAGVGGSFVLGALSAESFLRGYITNLAFFTSLGLGALFFVIIQHLTRAGWSVVVRRTAENVAGALPVMGLLAIPVVLSVLTGVPQAVHHVYHWTDAEHVSHDPFLVGKSGYLNGPFFLVRMAVYFGLWTLMIGFFRGLSVRQDESGDPELTSRMQARSAPAIILFALSVTFFAFDLLMSLNAHWYSTIFGVYYFAGSAMAFFALLAILMHTLQQAGYGRQTFSHEHFHDVGKLAFAFVVFWTYIAFSQYMLIWYGNIPEETGWFRTRQQGPWLYVSLALLFGHFVLPFLLMISRVPKRRPAVLAALCGWLLLMHWLDMFYLVLPHDAVTAGETYAAPIRTMDLVQCAVSFVGVGGVFAWAVLSRMRSAALAPLRDPRLHESLEFVNA